MPDDTLQQKIEKAKKAMANQGAPHSLLVETLANRRKTTLAAPISSDQSEDLSPEALAKKRAEARRAMESYDQKKRREMREQAEIEAKATATKIAELKQARIKLEEKRANEIRDEKVAALAHTAQKEADYQTRLAESKTIADSIINRTSEPVDTYRTLRTDVHEQVTTGGLTMAKIALEEEARRRLSNLPREKNVRPKLYTAITIGSVLLVLVSITALFITRLITSPAQSEVTPLIINSLIFTEEQRALPTDNKTAKILQTELRETITAPIRQDSILNLYPTQTITTKEGRETTIVSVNIFLQQAGIILPTGFTHFLENNFMLGITRPGTSTTSAPLYIFKTRSFENTLDSLLREENIILSNLLLPFVTPTDRAAIQTGTFHDVLISNNDIRTLTNTDGQTLATYGFLDRTTLAITTTKESFMRILTAYRTPTPTATTQ